MFARTLRINSAALDSPSELEDGEELPAEPVEVAIGPLRRVIASVMLEGGPS